VERKLVEMLAELDWHRPGSPVRVMSFSHTALQRVQRLAPGLPLVMLMDNAHSWPMTKAVLGDDWMLGPGIKELTEHPKFARKLRRTGRPLHVWTVNTDEQLQLCLDLGVAAVITDRPAYMLEQLDR
jgi:glycerophosphoryl diester phosphodiesterase